VSPRAAALWVLAALAITLATNNPVYRLLVVLAAVNVLAAAPAGRRRLRPLLAFVAASGALAVASNALLSHSGAHVLSRVLDPVPGIGGPVTLEALVDGVVIAAGVAASMTAAAVLAVSGDATDLVDAVPQVLHRSGAAVALALRMAPGLWRSFVAVREAQQVRGVRVRGLGGLRHVLVPVTLSALEDSLATAEAMDARGFGSGRRRVAFAAPWRRRDTLFAGGALAAAAAFIALHVGGLAGDWAVFPALGTLSVNPLAVVACALLVLPALWPSRAQAGTALSSGAAAAPA